VFSSISNSLASPLSRYISNTRDFGELECSPQFQKYLGEAP
jgi:hypothetical protein